MMYEKLIFGKYNDYEFYTNSECGLEYNHFKEWCEANNIVPDKYDIELYKKFKLATILLPEDGGFKFKYNTYNEYLQELIDNISKHVYSRDDLRPYDDTIRDDYKMTFTSKTYQDLQGLINDTNNKI